MKDLKAIKGKYYIQKLIDEGEHEQQDFKFAVSDAHKIAHSISAFANNCGGRLLVGVKDNGRVAGVRSEEDIHLILHAAESLCRPPQQVAVTAFLCEGGAVVVRAQVEPSAVRPVKCREADGTWRAYYRVADSNVVADPLMVRAWQRMAGGAAAGAPVDISGDGSRVLRAVAEMGETTLEALSAATHSSRASAADTVVALAAAGVLTFRHRNNGFVITAV